MLYEKIQLNKYPFTISFADIIKDEIKLGYLAWIKMLYKRNLLKKLKSLAKSVKILHICEHVVLAQLEIDLMIIDWKTLELRLGL